MEKNEIKELEFRVDLASKILSLAFRFGVLIGGACLLFYCYRLNYFPVGISVGDGFLLIAFAASFGVVYGLFFIGLAALGLWFTPFLRPIIKLVFFVRQRFFNLHNKEPLELVRPSFNSFMLGWIGILFILSMHKFEHSSIWTLPAVSFFLGTIIAAHKTISSRLGEATKTELSKIICLENKPRTLNIDNDRLKTERVALIVLFLATPLLMGGVSGILLEGAMRFANIKKGPSYVMLRAPYNNFVNPQLQAKKAPQVPDYTTFEGVDVMFSGIGQKTVVEFKGEKKIQRLEIPNESILIVPL